MEAVNSLLLLLTTLAPNTEPPENSPVTLKTTYGEVNNDFISQILSQANFCAEHEKIAFCGANCAKDCSNFNQDITCEIECDNTPQCICEYPRVRGPDGTCILPEECPSKVEETPPSCPENEVWELCGTACPTDCSNYNDEDRICVEMCVSGCFCEHPRVRGPDGDCVLIEECPAKLAESSEAPPSCPENEEWQRCGTACPTDCSNYNDEDRMCIQMCVSGCFCEHPRVRGPDGDCVLIEECPAKLAESSEAPRSCPENEVWQRCGTTCPRNCSNYNDEDMMCTRMCVSGCFCEHPRVRGPDGDCVLIEECPAKLAAISEEHSCPEREVWKSCGTACPKNCNNYDLKINCIHMCVEGCFCEPPRVRGPDGGCVLIEQCPPRPRDCPANETFSPCYAHCQKDCTNYNEPIFCPQMCVPGCVCRPPLVRGPEGQCVSTEECPESL